MLELIIFIFIIYRIFKKYNHHSPAKLLFLLRSQGFSNIEIVQQNQANYYIKANFHGDNYLFAVIKDHATISHIAINTLIEYATKNHYHNMILIPGNSVISDTAKTTISQYNIEIWNQAKINELSKQANPSTIIKPTPTHDTCKITQSNEPIQDGTKANSIFGNLFNHKIEKL